mmetsp:Transcript_9507/g.26594  ORF Transcript_9507/g.26594 Transcript_9507/m.26594 type:complete len:97 (-) Transcript_9507:1477-1767(-)
MRPKLQHVDKKNMLGGRQSWKLDLASQTQSNACCDLSFKREKSHKPARSSQTLFARRRSHLQLRGWVRWSLRTSGVAAAGLRSGTGNPGGSGRTTW